MSPKIKTHLVNIIGNNPKNKEILINCLSKTVNSKNFNCSFNEKESEKLHKLVLDYKTKNGNTIRHIFNFNFIYFDQENHESWDAFYKDLMDMSDTSVRLVPKTKTKDGTEISEYDAQFYDKTKPTQEAILCSLVYYGWNWDKEDIFDLATKILIRTAQGHSLNNGNKRNAILLTNLVLSYFGFYTFGSWKPFSKEYLNQWLKVVTTAVTKHHQKIVLDSRGKEDLKSDYTKKELSDKELHNFVKKFLKKISSFKII